MPITTESRARQVQKWVWILIYAGIVLLALGLSVSRGDVGLGWLIGAPGAGLVVAGIVLIWVRSRMQIAKENQ